MGRKWLAAFILLTPVIIILAATWAYLAGYRPGETTNNGAFIQPALSAEQLNWRYGYRALDTYALEGRWSLLLVGCDAVPAEECASALGDIRSLHIRLHRDTARVRRYLLVPQDYADEALVQLVGDDAAIRIWRRQGDALRRLLAERVDAPLPEGLFCIVLDPHGNLIMLHRRDQFGDALYDDLRTLLRLSQIG